MARVIRLDKIAYPEPYSVKHVDGDGNDVALENGVFTCMTSERVDYDVQLASTARTDGLTVLHATPVRPVAAGAGFVRESDFVAEAGTVSRVYQLSVGDEFTITLDTDEAGAITDGLGQFKGNVEDAQTITVGLNTITLNYLGTDIIDYQVGHTYRVVAIEPAA